MDASHEDLLHRIATIEARQAISELRAAYCWYTVRGMRREVVDLFTENAVFENTRSDKGAVRIEGREALFAYLAPMRPARRVPLVMNEVIRVTGEVAEGTCAMQSLGEDGFCGCYFDRFRKVGGAWLFSLRQFSPYWPVYRPNEEPAHPWPGASRL